MNRIRELRKQMNMTQRELAKYLQIADSTLSYWEMGRYEPDNEALMKLSRFFQVSIDYILGGSFIISESKAAYGSLNAQAAFNRIEFEGLTNGEIDVLAEYAEFIKSRKKKEQSVPRLNREGIKVTPLYEEAA